MTVQLALYKGKGQIGNAAIRTWTGSIYSHCELVVDGWCYSSSVMDGGVRRKRIDLDNGNWDLIPVPWVDGAQVVEYFHATDHLGYGWPSLIANQVFNRNQIFNGAPFCSEWCGAAMKLPCPRIFNPHTLGEVARFVGEQRFGMGLMAC